MNMGKEAVQQNRRRRRGFTASRQNEDQEHDYYSDDSNSDDKKGHDEKMYKGACSMGQFFLNPCLCLLRSGLNCWLKSRLKALNIAAATKTTIMVGRRDKTHKKEGRKFDAADTFLMFSTAIFIAVSMACFVPNIISMVGWKRHTIRRLQSDFEVNSISLEIPIIDIDRWNLDIGRWHFSRQFFLPQINEIANMAKYPGYYGGLEFVGPFGQPRVERPDEEEVSEKYLAKLHGSTKKMSVSYEHTEDILDIETKCYRNNWMQEYSPDCNSVHEIDLGLDYDESRTGLGDDQMLDTFYISHGYWRDVWVVHQRDQDVKSILKKSRWEHKYNSEVFYMTLNDALVMERLSKSPRIVDIFGHCAYTVWVEAIPLEVEEVVVPGEGFIKQEDLHDEEELQSQNDFTDEEKLDMALTMAESLADLHGFEDGLIIHDDVQLCQWLQTRDGRLKLGDFNRAEFPLFDPKKERYCQYNNGRGFGNYRAPEEFAGSNLDEAIDVWSFGNNIYGLLTGLWVFYENEDDGVVQKKIIKKETAFIDERYRTKNFITKNLVEVMEKCWAYKPRNRIDIFEAVAMLRATKTEYERMKAEEKFVHQV